MRLLRVIGVCAYSSCDWHVCVSSALRSPHFIVKKSSHFLFTGDEVLWIDMLNFAMLTVVVGHAHIIWTISKAKTPCMCACMGHTPSLIQNQCVSLSLYVSVVRALTAMCESAYHEIQAKIMQIHESSCIR